MNCVIITDAITMFCFEEWVLGTFVEEIIKGRKTFFVAPDKSRFPESYLEEYLTAGYECYFIETDLFLPISTKIEVILSVFKDCIMFFNIWY